MSIILQDKFFGCICGCHIGSAMGAPVEGMTYEEIDRKEMAGTGNPERQRTAWNGRS